MRAINERVFDSAAWTGRTWTSSWYFHVSWRRPGLWFGMMSRDRSDRPGYASKMFGLAVGHDLMRDLTGVFVHWRYSYYGVAFVGHRVK